MQGKGKRSTLVISLLLLAFLTIASPSIPAALVFGVPLIVIWWYVGVSIFCYLLWEGAGSHE